MRATDSEIGGKMKTLVRKLTLLTLGIVFLFGTAGTSSAQVKQVEMHIAGYLCGN
jgi:hypothetical protein